MNFAVYNHNLIPFKTKSSFINSNKMISLIIGLSIFFIASSQLLLKTTDVIIIQNGIVSALGITPQYGLLCNDKVAPCPMGNLFGGILRLVFHDATGNGKIHYLSDRDYNKLYCKN